MKPVLLTITGPTCSGKSFLESRLTGAGFGRVVSHTTRSPRGSEIDGRDYHFVDDTGFQRMVDDGEFLEHAMFGTTRYGSSMTAVAAAMAGTGRAVLVLEPIGADAVARHAARFDDWKHFPIWISATPAEQAKRFTRRLATMTPEQIAARLGLMLEEEGRWTAAASRGQIISSSYSRYRSQYWAIDELDISNIVDVICRNTDAIARG
jgi:guanylate kinase